METSTYDLIDEAYASAFAREPLAKFLRVRGERMSGARLPDHVRVGAPRMCTRNAWEAVIRYRYQYWEGYGWIPELGFFPFYHAWCVDPETKRVVDPTWHDAPEAVYLGVQVAAKLLFDILGASGSFGVFDKGRGFEANTAKIHFGYEA